MNWNLLSTRTSGFLKVQTIAGDILMTGGGEAEEENTFTADVRVETDVALVLFYSPAVCVCLRERRAHHAYPAIF